VNHSFGIRSFVALAAALGLGMACDSNAALVAPTERPLSDEFLPPTSGDGKSLSEDAPSMCLAVRGNGQLITAHFAAIARVLEHHGLFDGASGGSSGSITLFLLESVQENPLVRSCDSDDAEICGEQAALRAALLFKSMQGYLAELESAATGGRGTNVGTMRAAAAERDAILGRSSVAEESRSESRRGEPLVRADQPDAAVNLLDVLEASSGLLNPEIQALLSPEPSLFHIQDLIAGLENFGTFATEDENGKPMHRILVRPGLVNFGHSEVFPPHAKDDEQAADLTFPKVIARVADFYAGNAPVDLERMRVFLEGCAGRGDHRGRGDNWKQVRALEIPQHLLLTLSTEDRGQKGATCGAFFRETVRRYRRLKRGTHPTRLHGFVGHKLRSLVSTSVLTNKSGSAGLKSHWEDARAKYLAGEDYDWTPNFGDVRFGYWGRASDLRAATENRKGYSDEKSTRAMSLGRGTWKQALTFSPAEPGLARAMEINGDWVSAGGWSDLHPTLVLRNIRCEKVVYLTSRGGPSSFQTGMARILGATREIDDLYAPDKDSALTRSLAGADIRICTNWNDFFGRATDIEAISDDAYNAPWETSDAFFLQPEGWRSRYDNASETLMALDENGNETDQPGRLGCSPVPGIGPHGPE